MGDREDAVIQLTVESRTSESVRLIHQRRFTLVKLSDHFKSLHTGVLFPVLLLNILLAELTVSICTKLIFHTVALTTLKLSPMVSGTKARSAAGIRLMETIARGRSSPSIQAE